MLSDLFLVREFEGGCGDGGKGRHEREGEAAWRKICGDRSYVCISAWPHVCISATHGTPSVFTWGRKRLVSSQALGHV